MYIVKEELYEIPVRVEGEYTPRDIDLGVSWVGMGDVDNVNVFIGTFNITSQLSDEILSEISNAFLEYCEECI